MISPKELKKLKQKGVSDSIIAQAEKFLEENKFELFNLALLGNNEFRIMFWNGMGTMEAKIFPIPE